MVARNTREQVRRVVAPAAAPLLITALVVGVVIGLFQAATQINEMTLSFIPKLIAVSAAAVITGPWMLRVLVSSQRALCESIPTLIGGLRAPFPSPPHPGPGGGCGRPGHRCAVRQFPL